MKVKKASGLHRGQLWEGLPVLRNKAQSPMLALDCSIYDSMPPFFLLGNKATP